MVSGTDEHGTPIMVAADHEGVSPRELVDRNSAIIRDDLRRLGLSYDLFTRTTTANHHTVVRDLFRTLWEHGCIVEEVSAGRVLGCDRENAAGSLHRGHLPHLRVRGRAWRPVRQLRQPARPDRSDRTSIEGRRRAAGVPGDRASLPRPAGVRGPARRVDRCAAALALQRQALLARAGEGPPPPAGDPRPRLGCPHPRSRATRSGTTSGSTSGSTRWSGTSRPRSSGLRTVVRPMPGASGGRTPRRVTSTSWARTTSSSTA